ncbi:MAG: hypothetical protein ACYC8V_12485 [Caulobacteraceae bacterium]
MAETMSLAAPRLPAETAPPAEYARWWDRTEFRAGETPELPCPETIDITGLARTLVMGPPRMLPGGLWRFTASFELCQDAGRYPYQFKVGNDQAASIQGVQGLGAGAYEAALEHTLPAAALVEVHFSITRAAFHGELRFSGMAVERLGEA